MSVCFSGVVQRLSLHVFFSLLLFFAKSPTASYCDFWPRPYRVADAGAKLAFFCKCPEWIPRWGTSLEFYRCKGGNAYAQNVLTVLTKMWGNGCVRYLAGEINWPIGPKMMKTMIIIFGGLALTGLVSWLQEVYSGLLGSCPLKANLQIARTASL